MVLVFLIIAVVPKKGPPPLVFFASPEDLLRVFIASL